MDFGEATEELEEGEKSQESIELKQHDLLVSVGASETDTMLRKVAWLMNHYPRTRNSDIDLQIAYWREFDNFRGESVALSDLYTLTRLTSISRARATIQNTYHLFLADPEIQRHRGTLEKGQREKARKTTDFPVYKVYLDESGKTSSHLVVGSLWFLSSGREGLDLYREASRLKERRNFSREFHFSEMKRDEVDIYKQLVEIFVTMGGAISFKFISLPRAGVGNIQAVLEELFYHLLVKGIEHEDVSGRAPLPRIIQAWKDSEGGGSDKIIMANLADRLKQAAATIYENRLEVENFTVVDSKKSIFIQVADIIASSVNRILSRSGSPNHKDDLADFVMTRLGVRPTRELETTVGDLAVHLSL